MAGASRRRALDEIVQRYKRGVGRDRDVYVEGRNDKWVLDWYFRERGAEAVVYAIDTVDVPDGLLVSLGLNPGSARSRVIALSHYLSDAGVDLSDIRFLVDRDQEDLIATPRLNERVSLTDIATLELTLAHDGSLRRLSDVACCGRVDPEHFIDRIFEISSEIFLIRASAKRLGLPLKILTPDDFIFVRNGSIEFDASGYIQRILVASNSVRHRDAVEAELERCRMQATSLCLSRKLMANDHDVLAIALRIARQCGGLANRSVDDVRSLLLMGLEIDLFDSQPSVRSLAE